MPARCRKNRRIASDLVFVVHKHRARRLHYDFRLEMDGVLKSWALAKGPSLDPRCKRLAIEVEDHSIEYADFEGIIPEGYGKGTVMLWDEGTWTPKDDPHTGLREGKLEFTLWGKKLKGSFVLVQMKGRAANQWLLIKRQDRWARPSEEGEIVDQRPLSVLTDRNLEQIAADHDRVWTGCGGG
jgi:bifunctional non-homologous end joining protein LigD